MTDTKGPQERVDSREQVKVEVKVLRFGTISISSEVADPERGEGTQERRRTEPVKVLDDSTAHTRIVALPTPSVQL